LVYRSEDEDEDEVSFVGEEIGKEVHRRLEGYKVNPYRKGI
jgi:hypothetical protein